MCQEALGAFEDGGTGQAATGSAVADKEAGDVAFYEVLVKIGEEVVEALVSPAVLV